MVEEEKKLHVILSGRVQGVGFRYFVQQKAAQFGIKGWVRNRWDGTVEVMAQGDVTSLENFSEEIKHGPRNSNVTEMRPNWVEASGIFSDFRVRRTSD